MLAEIYDVAILINSCDAYEETWLYVFNLLFNYIGNNKNLVFHYYLNTESKTYENSKVTTINSNETSWSSRLIKCLERIKEKYVLIMLDDFFVMSKVDTKEIYKIISYMNNSNVDAVYLKHISGQSSDEIILDRYIKMNPETKYYMNFQAGIWKKESLISVLIPGLSPWTIEEENKINLLDGLLLYCDTVGSYTDCTKDVIPYLWALESGYGICKSKWLWNNKKLFRDNGMRFKRNKLGYLSKSSYILQKYKHYLFNKLKG